MEKKITRRPVLMEYKPKQSICFISKGRLENVPMEAIVHIYKSGTETRIYTMNREYVTYHSLQELLNELPVNEFVRINRSHIVSLNSISGIGNSHVILNNQPLPLSGYYRTQLKKTLGTILEQRYAWFRDL